MSNAEARRLRRFQQKVAGVSTPSGKGTASGARGYAGGGHPGRLLENIFPSTRFVAWDGESVTIPPDQLELRDLGEQLWRAETAVEAAKEAIGSDPWADAWRSRRRGQRFADRLGLGEDEYEVAVERHGVLRQELALGRRRARRLALDLERAQVSTHSYVLLMSSAGDELVQPTGAALSTAECLGLLCDAAERQEPRTVNVAYGGNYDVVKILADLRWKDVKTLWERPVIDVGGRRIIKPVHWRPRPTTWDPDPLWYRIEYTPKSCLKVARQVPERWARDKKGKLIVGPSGFPRKVWGKTMVLWDVIKFFQTTFVNAVEEWLGDLPELEMVRTQKKRRATFTLDELEREIIPYTRVEVELLVRVMEKLRDALVEARVPIARWDGVGAIAAALMHREGIPDHMPRAGLRGQERHLETLPEPVQEASQHAYFGGRIELCMYGRVQGPIHHYDINSAYPAVYPLLPSLGPESGRWEHQRHDVLPSPPRGLFSVSRVRWHPHEGMTTGRILPFPFRDVLGNILFPATWGNPLEGWYWRPEVDAALELSDLSIKLLETWSWVEKDPTVRPFGYVQELYDLRMRVGKKTGTGRVVKLGLNAHSGKTAQSAGWQTHGHVPQLHCTPWAGYITSATRAQLYRAAMQAPDAIIAISTDGVWSQVPLDLPVSTRLGDWEYAVHDELVCAQSGVYWTRDGDAWRVHCRGYDLEDHATGEPVVTREGVLEAWERGARSLPAQCTRFIGFGSALASPRQWSRRGTFWTATRELQLDPAGTKRRTLPGSWRPAEEPVPTAPRDPGEALGDQTVLTSRIYPLGWRGEEWGGRDREDGVPSAVWISEVEDTLV